MLLWRQRDVISGQVLTSVGIGLITLSLILGRIDSLQSNASDFAQGFCIGLGLVMMGASIVYNARGMARQRAENNRH